MITSLARIAAETHGYRKPIVFGASLILLGTGISLLYPPIIGKVVDLAIQGSSEQITTISWLCAILTIILFSRSAFSFLGGYLLDSKGTLIVNRLKERIFTKLLKNDYQYFSGQRVGDIVSRIQVDAETIRNAATHTVASILNQLFMFSGAVILMLYMDWKLTFIALALAPISAIVSAYFGPKITSSARSVHNFTGDSGAVASEALNGIQTVKIFGLEEQIKRKFSESIRCSVKNSIKVIRLNSIFGAILNFSTSLVTIGIFWYGGMKVIDGHMSGGTLIAFLFYSENLTQGFSVLSALYGQVAKAVGSSSRVFEILDSDEHFHDSGNIKNFSDFNNSKNIALIHSIDFTYATGNHALSKISFTIGKNKIVGLTGPSGCGKSTLANVLCGLYRAPSGYIILDNTPIENFSDKELHSTVVLVPQETFIFNDSILNNIRMVAPNASEQDVMQVAELACVTDFSSELPLGMETPIGERGSRLSGGQRQRIGLARALLLRPRLLILDEATSALDIDTEMRVVNGIMKIKQNTSMAVLFITHRLSILTFADSILEMQNGSIIWSGSGMDWPHPSTEDFSVRPPSDFMPLE